ncbi:hypothetical protein GDO81_021476 [Engystomops pustulosus]|uniref:Uncharacterized protein n=1 Tax=Engystomops pustulosus TaxID=76066 RepID=A0AAV6Z7T8_ENGPU|nr:hypothetical protein GDO81_021476 [Engystomops pustulosus]KAG8545036.1 hypothetical protein GDO81_021476 [Engystomops pustulosus]
MEGGRIWHHFVDSAEYNGNIQEVSGRAGAGARGHIRLWPGPPDTYCIYRSFLDGHLGTFMKPQ